VLNLVGGGFLSRGKKKSGPERNGGRHRAIPSQSLEERPGGRSINLPSWGEERSIAGGPSISSAERSPPGNEYRGLHLERG